MVWRRDWLDIKKLTAKEIVSIIEPTTTQIKVFNSDTTTHIASYWDNFSTFQSIIQKVLKAANKQSFSAVEKEELVLDLQIVLYSLSFISVKSYIFLRLDILLFQLDDLMKLVFQLYLQIKSVLFMI